MPQLKLAMPTRPNPNQLSDDEHAQLHSSPPDIAYDDLERLIRDWIMQYEGYDKLFKPILLGNGVTVEEWATLEGVDTDAPPLEINEKRLDELHTLYKAAEDRAYLIVLIKLYQMAVNWAPRTEYPTRKEV